MVNNLNIYAEEFLVDCAMNVVFNAFPSVDSFFLIGATLLTYLTLKELDRNKGGSIVFWIKFYVHRYIRLTGVYAILIFFHATLLKFFATGPVSYWMTNLSQFCERDWWRNLLYINNFITPETTNSCMDHGWYLGVDMQFFVISPIIIWSFWKSPKIGMIFASILTLAGKIIKLVDKARIINYNFSYNCGNCTGLGE